MLRPALEDAVLVVRIDDEETRNSLSRSDWEDLDAIVATLEDDDAVVGMVLTGAGHVFCSGGDRRAMTERAVAMRADPSSQRELTADYADQLQVMNAAVHRLARATKPVVAAVNGPAVGVGMSLALACDVRLGTPDARLSPAFVHVGLPGDGGITHFLPSIVGPTVARRLLLEGRWIETDAALRLGLLDGVVPAADVVEQAHARCREIGALPAMARAAITAATLDIPALERALATEAAATLTCQQEPDHLDVVAGSGDEDAVTNDT